MNRLRARPALFVLVVGAVVWLTSCSDGSTTTIARVTTAAPATTSVESPSTQSAIDAVGDVKGENGQAPPPDLKPPGDIESVQLSLEKDNLVLQVRTATEPPDRLPVAQLVFVLSIRMDDENVYELSMVGGPGWTGRGSHERRGSPCMPSDRIVSNRRALGGRDLSAHAHLAVRLW